MRPRKNRAAACAVFAAMIPFADWGALNRRHGERLRAACARVLDSGKYVLGEETAAFEKIFAEYCARQYCIGVGNGLDALTLTLRAAVACQKIKAGAEVILPANAYIAAPLAVLHAGLAPRLAEPDAATFNLMADTAAPLINKNTGAVMPVHLYGLASGLNALEELCRKRGLFLLNDAAQAHGARTEGKPAAAFGDAAAFSFYPGKNLGAIGDGGAVLTDDRALAEQVRMLRNYGSAKKYKNAAAGFNSRLDELQAAMLSEKLPLLDEDNNRRRALAARYLRNIRNPKIMLPAPPKEPSAHVWHIFAVRCKTRDALQKHLREKGAETLIHYPIPPHRQAAFAGAPFADA
ncbi:MAG: DegT/DnrJ/EryC1/StrS family aminotransferase, partial [Gammaproteobacteria bacterium]